MNVFFLRWCPFWERGRERALVLDYIQQAPPTRQRNLKTQPSPVIFDLFLRKTGAAKSYTIFFLLGTKTQGQRFQIRPVWRAFSKSSVFVTRKIKKSVFKFLPMSRGRGQSFLWPYNTASMRLMLMSLLTMAKYFWILRLLSKRIAKLYVDFWKRGD